MQNNAMKCAKKVCCTCKVVFVIIRPTFSLPSPLSTTQFFVLFDKTINVNESFAFNLYIIVELRVPTFIFVYAFSVKVSHGV